MIGTEVKFSALGEKNPLSHFYPFWTSLEYAANVLQQHSNTFSETNKSVELERNDFKQSFLYCISFSVEFLYLSFLEISKERYKTRTCKKST